MPQFKQKMERKEKIIMSIAIVLLMIAIYYFAFYQPCQAIINSYQTDDLMEELRFEQLERQKNEMMQVEIEANKAAGFGEVYPYNNLQDEIDALGVIMAQTINFDIDFLDAVQDESSVKRAVAISFTTSDYETAKKIIEQLYSCDYRLFINEVSIDRASKSRDNEAPEWNTSLQITFVEMMKDATTTEGLTQLEKNTATR